MAQEINSHVGHYHDVAIRLDGFIRVTGMGKAEIARLAKVDPATISRILSGSQPMGPKVIAGLTNAFDVNSDWLEFGQGEMGTAKRRYEGELPPNETTTNSRFGDSQSGKSTHVEKTLLFLSHLPEKDAELYVPYYDVEVTAGRIELFFDDVEEVPQGYVYAPQYRDCVMFNVKGNSMYELIYPGARLYVYRMPDKKYIDFGQIYLIVLNNNLRVLKYIRRHASDDTKITLASHNKEHDSWDVEKADILNLFLVKGFENQTAM